jgi:exopolysaccharide biosynthesis polyprenyl glycosylphosphotransferase
MVARNNKKRLGKFFSGILILSDISVLSCVLVFSYWLRFHSHFFPIPLGIPLYANYRFLIFFIGVLLIVLINSVGLYKIDLAVKFIDQVFLMIRVICLTMLLVLAGTFFFRGTTYSRSFIFMVWINLTIFLFFSRYILRIIYKKKIFPLLRKRIVLVGKPKNIKALLSQGNCFEKFMHVEGFISTRPVDEEAISGLRKLGDIDDFESVLERVKPDEVILVDLELARKEITAMILVSEKRMVSFKIVADLLDIMIQQFELETIDGINLIKIKGSPLDNIYNLFLKRSLDLAGAIAGLVIFSPVLCFISILVKLNSPGPAFFIQERISEGGKVFKIYKFRTMFYAIDKVNSPQHTRKGDDRITKIGKVLRMFNLDELPQLFNVLNGEMSLVGPRPERPYYVEQLKEKYPRYMSRHNIKSGITGWAQVHGFRQEGSPMDQRLKYDLYYLENWSIWLDLKILILTFSPTLAFKNAY